MQVAGFIVRELTRVPSNFRSNNSTSTAYLKASNVIGIEGIDTRALVRRLRVRGAMNGVLSTADLDDASLVAKARSVPRHGGPRPGARGGAGEGVPLGARGSAQFADHVLPARPATKHVVAIDYGMKWNILRCLTQVGCDVTVVPGTATAERDAVAQPGRHLPVERPRRPGRGRLRHRHREGPARQEADLRHLPGPPAARPGVRREDVQAEVRPPRREPAGAERADEAGRDHDAEPRLRGRPEHAADGAWSRRTST